MVHEPVMIGNHLVTFTPHYLPGVGPRVIVADTCPGPRNLSPEDARLFASHYQIAAAEAETLARRALRKRA
jgi:hypothetical protein